MTLGESAVVTGWVGGHAGRFIEEGLAAEGIGAAFVHTEAESRTCLSIVDNESRGVTEIYERGEPVAESEVAELLAQYCVLLGQVTGVTLSGTLPPGCPPGLYRTLIELARVHGKPAIWTRPARRCAWDSRAGLRWSSRMPPSLWRPACR